MAGVALQALSTPQRTKFLQTGDTSTGWFLLTFLRVFASICVPIEIATDLLTRFEREMPTAAERKRMELLFLAYRYNKSQGDYRDQTNRPRLQLGSLPRFPKLESPWVGQ